MLLPRPALLGHLVRLVRTCVSPFDHDDVDVWRRAVAGGLNDALGGVLAQVSLAPLDDAPRMVGVNIDHSVIEEYLRDWMDQDPLYGALEGRTRYTGSGLVEGVPGFREAWRRAAIYPDFFAKHRIRDTAAILHKGPPFLQVAVFTERFGDQRFLECAQPILDVLEPAFVQGAQAMLSYRAIVKTFVREIDESPTATALYSLRGRCLHRNTALQRLPGTSTTRRSLEAGLAALVRDAAGLTGFASLVRLEELLRGARRLHRVVPPYRLELILAENGLGTSPPVLLVMVRPADSDPSPLSVLTPREREVAELIAAGTGTRGIAEKLQISSHTVRRHTERVLAKFGVRSRLKIAALLNQRQSS